MMQYRVPYFPVTSCSEVFHSSYITSYIRQQFADIFSNELMIDVILYMHL